MNRSTQHFDKLVSKALDSSLSPTESDLLESLLNDNIALQRRYCKIILNESLLHWEESAKVEKDTNIISFPIWPIAASAAAIFVCMLSAWILHNLVSPHFSNSDEAEIFVDYTTPAIDQTTNFKQILAKNVQISPVSSARRVVEKSREIIKMITIGDESTLGLSLLDYKGRKAMSFERKLSTSTSNGVMPLKDGEMIQMTEMDIDPVTQLSSTFEVLRIYEFDKEDLPSLVDVESSIHINQSFSDTSDETEFVLSLHALGNDASHPLSEIGFSNEAMFSDNDQSTWEKIDTSLSIPEGTEYLVVSLTAKKSGLGALNSYQHEFFADELEVTFVGI
jgi:hypothetical protein